MKLLINIDDIKNHKSGQKTIPCECYHCGNTFYTDKREVNRTLKGESRLRFCSISCQNYYINGKKIELKCDNCGKDFTKKPCDFKKTKNHFCSKPCSTTYNNKHKSHGTRRSKLEVWIEEQLTQLYPNLHIDYNKTSAISSELDIYIPSINTAFELNGIFHYEPIYGVDKLQRIKENDISKSKACHDAKIDLCIIDTSNQKYFKESSSQKYLSIITNIIKERLPII